ARQRARVIARRPRLLPSCRPASVRHVAVFFFQAEDGIRDFHVTGVQTCALPISVPSWAPTTPCSTRTTSPTTIRDGGRGGRPLSGGPLVDGEAHHLQSASLVGEGHDPAVPIEPLV